LVRVSQLTPAAGDGIAVEPGDAGQQGNAAAAVLAGEEAGQQPAGAFVRSSQEAVESPMLTGHAPVGMLSASGARTSVDELPMPRVGRMFLLGHMSLPPLGRPTKEAKVLYSSMAEIIIGQ
jgi:hypothetical protein